MTAAEILKYMEDKRFDGIYWHMPMCVCTQNGKGLIMDPDCERAILKRLS